MPSCTVPLLVIPGPDQESYSFQAGCKQTIKTQEQMNRRTSATKLQVKGNANALQVNDNAIALHVNTMQALQLKAIVLTSEAFYIVEAPLHV